ncbi:MAG: PEP/pyruvate-binding domain-containing protein [Vulcanimicrobiota bacterium]
MIGSTKDSLEKSFAGQFDSFLNITGKDNLINAIERCQNSRDSIRIKHYTDFCHTHIKINVLVQEMIEADCSGIYLPVIRSPAMLMFFLWKL